MTDHLAAETFGPLGDRPIMWVDCATASAEGTARRYRQDMRAIVVGVDLVGACPSLDPAFFDMLLTTVEAPPSPWVGVAVSRMNDRRRAIEARVAKAPMAAGIAMDVARACDHLPFDLGITVESLGYSTLLAGGEFRTWRHGRGRPSAIVDEVDRPQVRVEREDDHVTITLARPDTRNAMRAPMRDALHEALCAVLDDPSRPGMTLRGEGDCFSTGGDLAEFGIADDMAKAHAIRTLRSCAARLHALGARARVELHGACIGSGIEIAAAATYRSARPGTFFLLPELDMGLIPGAGGTVSLARAIGRHRASYMLLSGRRIGLAEAVQWGLVEEVA
ncbi:enoyl-CoA hydratase/isomerase family protein [Sphingobium yanoikuyae]|uniref:Enoyl-CoA hydratase/isomerase family protein n=1 Tax=Sphingobium yanoikuyae TaxID=13690 RepID=A0A6M4G5U6_SPHYA|nr:enoyl-CoA hydratase/isomerase family protein [Sphingobium yanoikuyae]QJR02290.1 enoyl-CoA hydratase/isomerase family protein [Sphingobium yanoikuyae]